MCALWAIAIIFFLCNGLPGAYLKIQNFLVYCSFNNFIQKFIKIAAEIDKMSRIYPAESEMYPAEANKNSTPRVIWP